MNKYFVQTPCIIPLREPWLFEAKILNDQTKIELSCDIGISDVDIFYTVDGTKPEPYIPIVQGSKTYKYEAPFTLPVGKVTVKAIAAQREFQDLRSSVITKTFTVIKSKELTHKPAVHALPSTSKPVYQKDNIPKPVIHSSSNTRKLLYGKEDIPVSISNSLPSASKLVHEKEDICPSDVETLQSSELAEDDYIYEESSAQSDTSLVEGNDSKEPLPLQPQKLENDLSVEATVDFTGDVCVLEHQNISDKNTFVEKQEQDAKVDEEASEVEMSHMISEHCILCGKLRDYYPKYCTTCGKKLYELCSECGKLSICMANYCQYCGVQFLSTKEDSKEELIKQIHVGIMVKPAMENRSSNTLSFLNRTTVHSIQTSPVHSPPSSRLLPIRRSRSHSPGRGFWRVQTDFICTELKTHANNNLKFRQQIGSPLIHRLHSAEARIEDNIFVVQMKFDMCKHQR